MLQLLLTWCTRFNLCPEQNGTWKNNNSDDNLCTLCEHVKKFFFSMKRLFTAIHYTFFYVLFFFVASGEMRFFHFLSLSLSPFSSDSCRDIGLSKVVTFRFVTCRCDKWVKRRPTSLSFFSWICVRLLQVEWKWIKKKIPQMLLLSINAAISGLNHLQSFYLLLFNMINSLLITSELLF